MLQTASFLARNLTLKLDLQKVQPSKYSEKMIYRTLSEYETRPEINFPNALFIKLPVNAVHENISIILRRWDAFKYIFNQF